MSASLLEIHYWGHASYSLFSEDCHLLMDPVIDEPFEDGNTYFNPSRKINKEKMPPVKALFLSHNHGDHFDKPTLQYLSKYKPHVFCPNDWEILSALKFYNFEKITTLKPWQAQSFGPCALIPTPSLSPYNELGLIVQAQGLSLWNQVDTALDLKTIWTAKHKLNKKIDILFHPFQPSKLYCDFWPEEKAFPAKRLQGFLTKALAVEARFVIPSSFSLKLGGVREPLNSRMYQVTKPEFIRLLKLKSPNLKVYDIEAGAVLQLSKGNLKVSPDSSFFIKRTGKRADLSLLPRPKIPHLPLGDFEMSKKDQEIIISNMQKLPFFLKQLIQREFCHWLELCRAENYSILIEAVDKKEALKFLLYDRLEKLTPKPLSDKWDYRFHYRAEDLIKKISNKSHLYHFFIYRNSSRFDQLKNNFEFFGFNEDLSVDGFDVDHFLRYWPFSF